MPDCPVPSSRIHGLRVLAATLALCQITVACDTSQVSANPRTGTARDTAEQVMYGGRSVLASDGMRRGDLVGDTVLSFESATRYEVQGLRTHFLTTLGRPLSTLTAATGTYRLDGPTLAAHGKVTIVSDTTRRRLEGAEVLYDVAKDQLSSDSAFVASVGTRRLSGVGFTADPGLFTVRCRQKCTGALGP